MSQTMLTVRRARIRIHRRLGVNDAPHTRLSKRALHSLVAWYTGEYLCRPGNVQEEAPAQPVLQARATREATRILDTTVFDDWKERYVTDGIARGYNKPELLAHLDAMDRSGDHRPMVRR